MKKLLFIALCTAAVGSVSAQKANVDAAKKLAGKIDKIEEARALIKEAIANPETKDQANTYVIASDIELKAYDKAKKGLGLNSENAEPEKLAQMNSYLLNSSSSLSRLGRTTRRARLSARRRRSSPSMSTTISRLAQICMAPRSTIPRHTMHSNTTVTFPHSRSCRGL